MFELLIIVYFIVLSLSVWGYDYLWCGFRDLFKKERNIK